MDIIPQNDDFGYCISYCLTMMEWRFLRVVKDFRSQDNKQYNIFINITCHHNDI